MMSEDRINPRRADGGDKIPPAYVRPQNSGTVKDQAMRFRDFS